MGAQRWASMNTTSTSPGRRLLCPKQAWGLGFWGLGKYFTVCCSILHYSVYIYIYMYVCICICICICIHRKHSLPLLDGTPGLLTTLRRRARGILVGGRFEFQVALLLQMRCPHVGAVPVELRSPALPLGAASCLLALALVGTVRDLAVIP